MEPQTTTGTRLDSPGGGWQWRCSPLAAGLSLRTLLDVRHGRNDDLQDGHGYADQTTDHEPNLDPKSIGERSGGCQA